MKLRTGRALSCALMLCLVASCGGDDVAPPPLDGGGADVGAADAGFDGGVDVDLGPCTDEDGDGHGAMPCGDDCDDTDATRFPGNTEVCDADDEDCSDTTYGLDADADGFQSAACCNGTDNCGTDCDDTRLDVNPSATESCNAGVDDDCNGLADAADGVCVPCPSGFVGIDADCTDVDECAVGGFCGTGSTACENAPLGSFTCTCASGYDTATPTGALCENIDECAASTNPCGPGACTDNAGSYVCTCPPGGYTLVTSPAFTCVDIDECATGAAMCTTSPPGVTCVNSPGSFACNCPAGYGGSGTGAGGCTDVNECAPSGTNDCESTVAACANTTGSFTCTCLAGFVGTGHGAGSCRWNDPALSALTFGAGATLTPAFAPGTTMYTLTMAPGATSATVTPTVAQPTRATITVAGAAVASGASAVVTVGFAPRPVAIVVTTETGMTRTYTVLMVRRAAYVKASNTGAGDSFGWSSSLSADGTRLAVGATAEDSSAVGINGNQLDNTSMDSGAVYLFSRTGATWTQEAYLKASNTGAGDSFGRAVSLSADGSRLAVGAPNESSSAVGVGGDQTSNAASQSGAAYVFSRTGTVWVQEAYIKASNTNAFDTFGRTLALSGDGTRLAVGADGESSNTTGINGDQLNNSALGSGAAYVFARTGTAWAQEAYVKASNSAGGDVFAQSGVALSNDGARLAVGATGEDSNATGVGGVQTNNSATDSGAVYLFSRVGAVWTQEAYIKASNTAASASFGGSVSLSADAARLAVGAYNESGTAAGSGAVYVFSRAGAVWAQEAYVKASNIDAGDAFGTSVSLSADGLHLAVGATGEASNATSINGNQANNSVAWSGAVYVLSRAGTAWSQDAYIKPYLSADTNDVFGWSVSLSADGTHLGVSTYSEDSNATGIGGANNNSSPESGAAYAY